MTPETQKHGNVAEKLRTVKAAWDKAPAGPKKATALTHYTAAEKAHAAKHDDEAIRELESATKALS